MAKKYVGSITLAAFMEIVKTELGKKMDLRDVLSTLENYDASTDADKLVAASAIKALKDQVNTIVAGDGKVNDSDKLDGYDSSDFVLKADLLADTSAFDNADNQTATDKAISAKLAYQIISLIKAIDADGDGKADVAANAEQLGGKAPGYYATASNGDGKADMAADSEMLGGQTPDYYAKASDITGVVKVGEDGKVPSDVLPSYVDDVIEGYLDTVNNGDGTSTLTFYEDEAKATAITGERGKIYVDLGSANSQCYRWSGSTYVKVSDNDMVEITDEEVTQMWNDALAAAVYE